MARQMGRGGGQRNDDNDDGEKIQQKECYKEKLTVD